MSRFAIAAAVLMLVAGCGTRGPVYRGDPPPGMSPAEYKAQLLGEELPSYEINRENQDHDGGGGGGSG
ncbi:hypothetical protein [Mesorhizobium xinjiangense]|uniref:hypothetical protein n=1 Tax=Mesorhizobium xinjiangense TaxID=2678685 RepID=UPI0012ED38DE|nr:hypothetical protein [Mesorhizobium xinjiangense]